MFITCSWLHMSRACGRSAAPESHHTEHSFMVRTDPRSYSCPGRHIPRRGRDSISLLAPRAGGRAHQQERFQVCPSRAYNSCAIRARRTLPPTCSPSQACRAPAGRPSSPAGPCVCVSTITRHAKPGFAIAWTAMVDPQSVARPATMCSSRVFCAAVRSCRRPLFRRCAPRAGQQQRMSTPSFT